MSSIADKTEYKLHSTRENTPLDEMSNKQRLNVTDTKQMDSHSEENMGNGGKEIKASTDQSYCLKARNGNATGDSEEISTFT